MKIVSPILIVAISFIAAQTDPRTVNFPKQLEIVKKLPNKENFWIFIMAGQSNMAGRGQVEPQDTIPNARVLALNKQGQWYVAKEPLNLNEPTYVGLDCGLSFGKELLSGVNRNVTIGVVHCAIGGTSVEQWLSDANYRDVKLLSNADQRIKTAMQAGTIKGIIWHQGESNANKEMIVDYIPKVEQLFTHFREVANNPNLPVFVAELGGFITANENYPTEINALYKGLSESNKNVYLVKSADLKQRGDNLHFDSPSQRELGRRYAQKFLEVNPK